MSKTEEAARESESIAAAAAACVRSHVISGYVVSSGSALGSTGRAGNGSKVVASPLNPDEDAHLR